MSLPSRELIADSVETMVSAHRFDGMVCIPNCDKITPGMLMAAVRLDVPAVFVSGGPMATGRDGAGRAIDLISVFEGVGAYRAGTIGEERLSELEKKACPSCGSCSGLFTANSMNCLMEALGLALPFNGTALAKTPEREAIAKAAAARIVELIARDLTPRKIVTREAVDDAFALDMAMGGSSNTVLHTLAIAREAGLAYPVERQVDDKLAVGAGAGDALDFIGDGGEDAVGRDVDDARPAMLVGQLGQLDDAREHERLAAADGKPVGRAAERGQYFVPLLQVQLVLALHPDVAGQAARVAARRG